jgi:diguanylate cyclase (GGDEF)-like protein/PAS domain S-box-containing protein
LFSLSDYVVGAARNGGDELLNNRPIGARLTLMVAVMIGALALVVGIAVLQLYTQLMAERQRHTRELVETAASHAAALHRRAEAGEISGQEARRRALQELTDLRYDEWNYFWITDLQPVLLAHPEARDLVGRNVVDVTDPDGRALFREFVTTAVNQGGGVVYYKWPKPGERAPVRKLAYVRHFEPWGWVIGSGLYLDDIEAYAVETALRLIVLAAGAAGSALIILWLVRRSIVRPLRAATDVMKRLADGDHDVSPEEVGGNDEVGDLMRAMRVFKQTQDENQAMRRAMDEEARITGIVFNTISEAVVVTDKDNRIRRVNPAFTRTTGYRAEDVIGSNPRMLQSGRHEAGFYQEMWSAIARNGFWVGEIWNRRADGQVYPEALSIHAVRDDDGATTEHVAIFSDISERKSREMRMRWRAEHDALTGLPNRAGFEEMLTLSLCASRRHGGLLAVLFIDLDGFKAVNDTHGHDVGDELLRLVATRLQASVRENDHVARLGGDEFTVILGSLRRCEDAAAVAEKLLYAVCEPCALTAATAHLGASIGVAFPANETETTWELVKRADQSMYRAKATGRNSVVVDELGCGPADISGRRQTNSD